MVLIEELQTARYYRINDKYLSTSAHFHEHPEAVAIRYFPNPSKRASSARPTKSFPLSNAASRPGGPLTYEFRGELPSDLSATRVSQSTGSTQPRIHSAGPHRTQHYLVDDHSLRAMAMPSYLYKANGAMEQTLTRMELPRPRSACLPSRELAQKRSEYSANFVGRQQPARSLSVKTGTTLAGTVASKSRMAMNGVFGYDGGLAPDRPL